MKELEKQYNKNVKNPANFSIHRPSYMAGGRAALEWVLSIDSGFCNCGCPNDSAKDEAVLAKIKKELEE